MFKPILHWGWRLLELALLVVVAVYLLLQGGVYFVQLYPQQSSALIQQYLGVHLTYEQLEVEQHWSGFEVTAKQLDVVYQNTHFQAKEIGFDVDLYQLAMPGLFLGHHLSLHNAHLKVSTISIQTHKQNVSSALQLPTKFWRQMTVTHFNVSTHLQQQNHTSPIPVRIYIPQMQSRLGVRWLVNGEVAFYLFDEQSLLAGLSFQSHFNVNELGFLSEGHVNWQFYQPLDLKTLHALLSKEHRLILPLGQMAFDGKLKVEAGQLKSLIAQLHLQELRWPEIQQDQILPKSLAVQINWLSAQKQRLILEHLRIDNRYVGHQNLAEVLLTDEYIKFKMSQFNASPFNALLAKALQVYFKVPQKALKKQSPHIDIDAIELALNRNSGAVSSLFLHLNQLALPPLLDYPGVNLLQATLQKEGQNYQLRVAKPIVIDYEKVFENPLMLSLQKTVSFNWDRQKQTLSIPLMSFTVNQIPFQFQWHSTGLKVKQAVLSASPQKLQQVKALLPYPLMPDALQKWLKDSLVSGENIQVKAQLSGDLTQFPFKKGGGQFRATAAIQNTTLKFQPDWPAIQNFNAYLDFQPYDLTITTPAAKLMDLQASKVKVKIANLAQKDIAVDIQAQVQGKAEVAQQFLLQSPLAKQIGLVDFLQKDAQLSGQVAVRLNKIWIPVNGFVKKDPDVQVEVDFKKTNLTLYQRLPLKHIEGTLYIHNQQIKAPHLKGRLTGVPFSIKVETDHKQKQMTIDAKGGVEMPKHSQIVSGSLQWQSQFLIPYNEKPFQVKAKINFDKFYSKLPLPLDQAFFSTGPVTVDFKKQSNEGSFHFQFGQNLSAKGYLNIKKAQDNFYVTEIEKLFVSIGKQSLLDVPDDLKGIQFKGEIEKLDMDAWLKHWSEIKSWLPPLRPSKEFQLTFAPSELNIHQVQFKQHIYHDLRLALQNLPNQNRVFKLTNPRNLDIQGVKKQDKWFVQANKIHIQLPEFSNSEEMVPLDPACLPPIAAQKSLNLPMVHFEGKDIWWGKWQFEYLQFNIESSPQALQLKNLEFGYGEARGTGQYQWQYDDQISQFKINIISKNVKDLSHMLDIEKGVTGKKAKIKLFGSWQGGPQCFDLRTVTGRLKARLDDGVIKDVEPGFARLLGLLSINSIIKRLSLDLSDVTSKGLAYSIIQTDAKVEKGQLKLKNLQFKAPSVQAKLWGRVDLVHKKYHLKADVTPAVGSSLATIAAIVGAVNPVTAILTFTLLKNIPQINEDLVTYQYKIHSSWDNPIIEPRNVEVETFE